MGNTLEGRRVLVTGGASGIGRACAEQFADAGADVLVLDRDGEGARVVAAATAGRALECDLGADSALDAIADEPIDVVVNNAGFQHVAPIEDFDRATYRTMMRLMLEVPFELAQRLLPGMYHRGWGRFVNISSVHGKRASAYKAGYVTAKHGLEGLSKVIAVEGAARGVTSNAICPGYVRTPLVERQIEEQARAHGISADSVLDEVLLARTPLKRLLEPSEVARLAVFLCTEAARSITGASYDMAGGWTAT
ncbi:MAG: 3-hydroxybutyrate dehydrogenase [Nocardioidaceae bacterium]